MKTPESVPATDSLRSSGVVGGMTAISRILGFIRDMVVARYFGADAATDAFFVAFKIPNFLRRLFAEGAFSQAFVPVFAEYRQQQSFTALKQLVDHVSGVLAGILLLLVAIGIIAAPLLVLLFAPGFVNDSQRFGLAVDMLRLTFPYLFLISLVALAGGILNSMQRFAVPALTPVFLNLSMIVCAIWLRPHMEIPIMALAWGVLFAGIIQLLFQLPFLQQLGLLPRPRWRWQDSGVQKVIKLMLPAIFGSAVVQINLLLDTILASLLISGSVTWLYYSDRLVELPLGIFGIAIATVMLPTLSRHHANNNPLAFQKQLAWGIRFSLLITFPATLGLIWLAQPLLCSLFQYGAFTITDTRMASYSLIAYALGLPAFVWVKILAPAFYARQDIRTPVKIAIKSLICNMTLNILFIIPLIYQGFSGAHAGLALATSLAAWLQTALLWRALRKHADYQPITSSPRFYGQLLLAGLAMSAMLGYFLPANSWWYNQLFWQRGLMLAGLIMGSAICYFAALWLTGMRWQQFK